MERDVRVGQLIAGKYRVEKVLGRGGMGVVMLALHEQLNQRVALKFLTDDAYQQPEAVTRFLREARSAVQIQSEHVARVMDVGTLESGAPYMVMEYLRGLDLKEVSTRRGPLPISEAIDFVLQACDAVAEAHSLGIVHRDLKPSNLFLSERPDGTPMVKVLDFGISKALYGGGGGGDTSQRQMTASAAIMGSPQYMSPEQIRSSKNVDARADVWALGTILHELITGAPAYVADTVPGLLAMIVADPPPPLSASRPDTPAELEAAVLRCLEKDRERRFGNVSELARAIERFASPESRPLVRRISRVLGDSTPGRQAASLSTGNLVMRETAVQTHNTWARTGRHHDSLQTPFYARHGVQLGAGVGVLGVALVAWFLVIRGSVVSGSVVRGSVVSGSVVSGEITPAAAGASPVSSSKSSTPNAQTQSTTMRASPSSAASGSGLVAPGTGGVRPVLGVEPPPPPPPTMARKPEKADDQSPLVSDDDPRAPHNFRDDDGAYPSASAKKKELAVASKKPRPKPVAVKRPTAPDGESEAPQQVSQPQPAKKSDTLDLFDDTK